jgi:hypothetical protein
MIGRVFGQLMVRAEVPHADGRRGHRWQCQCACGQQCVVWGAQLRRGDVTHCGCRTPPAVPLRAVVKPCRDCGQEAAFVVEAGAQTAERQLAFLCDACLGERVQQVEAARGTTPRRWTRTRPAPLPPASQAALARLQALAAAHPAWRPTQLAQALRAEGLRSATGKPLTGAKVVKLLATARRRAGPALDADPGAA